MVHYSEKVEIKGNLREKVNIELENSVCGLEGHLVYQQNKSETAESES